MLRETVQRGSVLYNDVAKTLDVFEKVSSVSKVAANPMLCSKHGGCGFQSDCGKCRHEEFEDMAASSGAQP